MKLFLLAVIVALVVSPSLALAGDATDQVCYGDPLSQGQAAHIRLTLHGQVFTPTVTHITKVAIFANSVGSDSAKVKIKIQKAWLGSDRPTYEKTVVVNKDPWWVEANFSEVPVTAGANYFLTVEPLNGAMIDWYLKDDPDCNQGGYAFVGGKIERNQDFYFLTRGDNQTIQLENPITSGTPQQENSSSSTNSASGDATSQNSNPATSSSAGAPSQIQPTGANGGSASKLSSPLVSDQELANANKIPANSQEVSEEEMSEILKMIADDYANRRKGMFGLSGVVGSFLTPTVFYSLVALILIFVILLIVKIAKRTKGVNE